MPVKTVTLALPAASLTVGQTAQATVTVSLTESDGLLDQRPITFTSNNAAVATVDANGLVTARGAGTASITATVEGVVSPGVAVTVALPAIVITAAQEAAIMAVPLGGTFVLQGPTKNINCVVSG